ncbi:DUF2332 family protein [Streptosporangium sandarakinum]|uniref:DUF2332 family protein n=1 Tax=Streptosporangium sandarakinum TaxID=1260955 RepID=UPI00371DDAC9
MDTAERYRRFSEQEVRGRSPAYEALARGIASDARLLALIDGLPHVKRQPNLLLASVRFLGGPSADFPAFRQWTVRHWQRVRETMLTRRTQTNEAGRCASLLPVLAGLPGNRLTFLPALDGEPLALAGPHGEWLDWLTGPDA